MYQIECGFLHLRLINSHDPDWVSLKLKTNKKPTHQNPTVVLTPYEVVPPFHVG